MKIRFLLCLTLFITHTPQLHSAPQTCTVTLKGAHVWGKTGFETRDLSWSGKRFVATPPSESTSIAANWLWLTPPLADGHTHTLDTPEGQTDSFHNSMVKAGVFYALNPNSILGAYPILKGPKLVDVAFSGGGLTRPGGHPRPLYEYLANSGRLGKMTIGQLDGRAFHEASNIASVDRALAKVKASGTPFVKLMLLYHDTAQSNGLSAANFRHAVAKARTLGLRALVHVDSIADFRLAVSEKVHAIVHAPGVVIDDAMPDTTYMLTPEDARRAQASGIIVVPTIAPAFYFWTGAKLARAQKIQAHNLTMLRDANVMMAAGADIYGRSILDEINLFRATTLFGGDALIKIATENGLRLAFPDRKVGRLEAGWDASFVGYYSDPRTSWDRIGDPIIGARGGVTLIDNASLLPPECSAPK
jgi:hypothetical protein